MTFLIFAISTKHYALPVTSIQVVLPNLIKQDIHKTSAPDYLVGWLNYHDSHVPVIDLCVIHAKRPTRQLLSSRIILINYTSANSNSSIIGLLAEHVTETVKFDDVLPLSLNSEANAIQLFDLNEMLPDDLNKLSFLG